MNEQNSEQQPQSEMIDSALTCLVIIANILGVPVDPAQLRRSYVLDGIVMDSLSLVRAAQDLGLKSNILRPPEEKFTKMPFPAIAVLAHDYHVVVLGTDGENVSFIDPCSPQPLTAPLASFLQVWVGDIIFVTRRYTLEKEKTQFGLGWFIPVIWKYKKFFTQVLLISLVLHLLGLLSPVFSQNIIDKVLIHRSLSTLDVFISGMVLVTLFHIGLGMLRTYLFTHTTSKIDVTLSSKLFNHITALPLKYFATFQVGEVVSRVRELDTIHRFITGSALTVVLDTVFAVVYLVMMFTYSTTLSVVALAVLPLFVILSLVVTPLFEKLFNERFLLNANNQSYLIESITGIQTIKALAIEGTVIQKWDDMLARYTKTVLKTTNLETVANNIAAFLEHMFNLSLLWFGANAVMEGKLTVGQLIAFQMLAGELIMPIMRLVNMWKSMQQVKVSVKRVGDILNEAAEPAFNPNRTTLPQVRGEIVLDQVKFRYRQDGPEILRGVSLHVKAGMKVGIVGRSGSGKSTLTKLIQRLYVPESGRVLIDGVDLAQVEPAWLRRQIGVVLQDNFLFSGTIRDNIAMANPYASEEEVVYAASLAGAHDFIMKIPQGYNTPVGERGTSLSGGQRQLIAIARALITNPSILIFDEATSALDYETERIIMDNLRAITEGRTTLIIAHRLSTVRHCDKIVVMERGIVVEEGTHEELLERKGYYYNLCMLQESN